MKQSLLLALPLLGAAIARPTASLSKRQVPQEHAHENILRAVNELLQLDNPDNIQDAVFGLLGAAAAADGAGDIADPDCLQQATADQAFTNAKAAGDVEGMTNALIFRALERNTGQVGLASVLCESIEAVNPEIAALTQHQDAAGEGAQELNKEIATELARQIASIGGDPLLANEASTFAPGDLDDETAQGNSCNDEDDAEGCINSLGLRVDDLSEEEILAAVADVEGAAEVEDEQDVDVEEDAQVGAGAGVVVGGNRGGNRFNNINNGFGGNFGRLGGNLANILAGLNIGGLNNLNLGNGINNVNGLGANVLNNCNARINFGIPSDGRGVNAFEPADLGLFAHGSALNIDIISGFICQQIQSRCNVGVDVLNACNQGVLAAQGLNGIQAANAFNLALGF